MKKLGLIAVLLAATSTYAQDAVFRGNVQHNGVYDAAGIPNFTGVKWQFHTRGPIVSSPVVAGDTLYIGSGDHVFYALDTTTGAVKWKFKTDGRINSTAAISAGFVYFESYDSNFYALDAATGQLKWKFKTDG